LYIKEKVIDLFTADLGRLQNDDLYNVIAEFARVSPNESNRHDFKLKWADDSIQDVAAFANTFGGLLFIGVAKGQNDLHATLAGVPSTSELTTGIAMAISTNISPTPVYDIAECYKPAEPGKRFCVIRVQNSPKISLVTKKGLSPVWLRDIDRTTRADAAQLRSLIDREKNPDSNAQDSLWTVAQQIFDHQMVIGKGYPVDPGWTVGKWERSRTFFKLALIPTENRLLRLDRRAEGKFVHLVHGHYRRIASNLSGTKPVAEDAEERGSDFYEYRWYHTGMQYENRWRITNRLLIAHATQIEHDGEWSLTDTVMYTLLLLKIGSKWWESLRYFGDGMLISNLYPMELPLARGASKQYSTLFRPGEGDFGMNADVLTTTTQRKPGAQAFVNVNFGSMQDDVPELVTSLFNSLLRDLGHAVLWEEFKDTVQKIWEGQPS
jgi:schlafen family protein